MRRALGSVVVVLALGTAAPASVVAQEATERNQYCPVWPERQARDAFTLEYRGRQVRFCCATCLRLFRAHPEKYIANVPQLADLPPVDEAAATAARPRFSQTGLLAVLAVLLLLFLGTSAWHRQRRGRAGLAWEALLVIAVALVVGVLLARRVLVLEADVAELRRQVRLEELEALIHNNTFTDYGFPPVPSRPPSPPRLRATFYRGNDERSPLLFNGGQYLTAYFHLSLRRSDRRALRHGDAVAQEWLELRFEIERAPHTPDYFWTDDVLGHIYLTRQTDRFLGLERPVEDRVDLGEIEPMQTWEVLYPIGRVAGQGEEHLEGVVYVAEEWLEGGKVLGASLHYALQYDVRIVDGVIDVRSDLWMGALFRPRKSPVWKVPPEEWLSWRPIPPLPGPQADDPELLGISDYQEPVG